MGTVFPNCPLPACVMGWSMSLGLGDLRTSLLVSTGLAIEWCIITLLMWTADENSEVLQQMEYLLYDFVVMLEDWWLRRVLYPFSFFVTNYFFVSFWSSGHRDENKTMWKFNGRNIFYQQKVLDLLYLFHVKIFSYTNNFPKIFLEYYFTTEIFAVDSTYSLSRYCTAYGTSSL